MVSKKAIKGIMVIVGALVGAFVIPSLFVGYMHWDIAYITTIQSWSDFSRLVFMTSSILCSFVCGMIAKFYFDEE